MTITDTQREVCYLQDLSKRITEGSVSKEEQDKTWEYSKKQK
jgi:hypothetical protein